MSHIINITENSELECSIAHFSHTTFKLDSGFQLNNFKVDNLKPRSIEKPRSINELSELIQDLNSTKTGLIPFGGKTRILIGNLPKKFHTAVDLNSLPKDII